MKNYRVAFIIEQTGGNITHTANLRTNVPKDGSVDPYWFPLEWITRGPGAKLPVYRTNWTLQAGWQARRAIAETRRKSRIDALLFETQVPAMLSPDWMRRIPTVISLDATPLQFDGVGEFYGHPPGPPLFEHIKWRLHRQCYSRARRVVPFSNWTRKSLIENYQVPADRIVVIPPGVNIGEWKRPTPRRRKPGPTKILFVGYDLKRKGGQVLLEAFRLLQPLDVELHLVTRTKISTEPGVFVYNDLNPNSGTLKKLYHECDIFCLPTRADFLPMVLSEAGAAGLPLVSTDIAGIPEIVKDGVTGFTVPRGDVGALKIALERLVENSELRLGMGEAAADFVSREFDAERNTTRLLDVIKQVADTA